MTHDDDELAVRVNYANDLTNRPEFRRSGEAGCTWQLWDVDSGLPVWFYYFSHDASVYIAYGGVHAAQNLIRNRWYFWNRAFIHNFPVSKLQKIDLTNLL